MPAGEAGSTRIEKPSQEYLDIGTACCDFIVSHLILFEDEQRLCFGYIPGEEARVHNANMLGAALLARVWKHKGESRFLEASEKAMAYSMDALTGDDYWPYGELDHHQFIDNFHTGFNLVALKSWMDFTGISLWEEKLKKAYEQFLRSFWLDDGCPKYYHNKLYPIDIHCSVSRNRHMCEAKKFQQKKYPNGRNDCQVGNKKHAG